MCGRMTTVTWDELVQVARSIMTELPFNYCPDWPASSTSLDSHDVFPNSAVDVIATDSSHPQELSIKPLLWGFEQSDHKKVVFNTRFETASRIPLWKESFDRRRCIIPVDAFYETSRDEKAISPISGKEVKQSYRFIDRNNDMILLSGIWKKDRFSLLTMEPNGIVGAVHDRMPVMLSLEDAASWLEGGVLTPSLRVADNLEGTPVLPKVPGVQESLFD